MLQSTNEKGKFVKKKEKATFQRQPLYQFFMLNCKLPQKQLRTTHLLPHSFCRFEVLAQHSWVLCSGSQEAVVQVLAGLCSHLEVCLEKICFQAHSDCQENSLLCSCMTEGPGFLLTVGWRLPSGPRKCLQFLKAAHSSLPRGSLNFQSQRDNLSLSSLLKWILIQCNTVIRMTLYPLPLLYSIGQKQVISL